MVDAAIVRIVQRYLRSLETEGLVVRFGIVFGSQATGTADEWSDIDLLVVSPQFDRERTRQDIGLLWRLAARTDSRIEPLPCGERQWQEETASPLVEIARRQGERISFPASGHSVATATADTLPKASKRGSTESTQ